MNINRLLKIFGLYLITKDTLIDLEVDCEMARDSDIAYLDLAIETLGKIKGGLK